MSASASRLSFLKSSGYATITAGSAVMLVALTMIAGRWLPASEYGKFSFAIALASASTFPSVRPAKKSFAP